MDLGLTQREITMLLWGLAKAAFILVAGILVARLVRSGILRLGTRRRLAMNVATLLANLAQVGIVVFAVILILPTFGVDWAGLLTVVGTVGLAISLAFQICCAISSPGS